MQNISNKKSHSNTYKDDRSIILKNIDISEPWMSALKHNPISSIINKGLPSDVFLLLRNLYKYDHKHTLYRLAEQAVFKQSGLHRIFHKGSDKFQDKRLDTNELFFNQLQRIHLIADFGATNYLNPVKDEIVSLLKFQNSDGRFPLYYQHNAHACIQLIKLGMEGSVMIDKCIHWLLKRQRHDGGWLHKNNLPTGKKYDKAKSCIWTTAEIASLLSMRSLFRKSNATDAAITFLYKNILMDNASSTLLNNKDSWEHLHISPDPQFMFAGGSLKILEILSSVGYNCSDKKYKKLYNWLLEQQLDSGFFPRISSKMPIDDTQTTIRALVVIKKTEANRNL